MSQHTPGRHRRPGRLGAATTLTRTAAVAVTSSGLVAGAALSASASPNAPASPDVVQDQRSTAGAEALLLLGQAAADRTLTAERPARAAAAPEQLPAGSSPVSWGTSGFTAVPAQATEVVAEVAPVQAAPEQPAAQPAPQNQVLEQVAERSQPAASRSSERAQAPAQQQSAPAQAPAQPNPPPAPAPATGGVLSVAAAYTGIPYVYGGSTPAGFDCSGYTQFVFAQVGISLPRTAAGQQAAATPVSNPQPGDLVFYGYPAYHVGIYAGDGMMYDSGRPGIPTQLRAIFGGVSGYGRVG